MGAKQSKRSIDISGKEAESAGEVAASIAGGEGRLEPLADADALKPQLNGDAHIHDTEEKQKDIDSGTPENEKDATTEKETKQEEDKESAPLTNGESEQKVENGESTPTPEDGKKPKKEKVKKKWSLRSISFSRKDKPKQEKKTKEEEPKTNGEPEKVPEETADVTSKVPVVTETAEEAKSEIEIKEDKTPETPVTEPITNGSSTPDLPKAETPVVEEPAVPSSVPVNPEKKTEAEPEQLPVNGHSVEDPIKETIENVKNEDKKEEPAEIIPESPEIVPEIPIIKEVCVEQMPLIDSTPPPLPANPPPSSVASFAATTMAPELSDASLSNTVDNTNLPPPPPLSPPSDPVLKDKVDEITPKPNASLIITQNVSNDLSSRVKVDDEGTSDPVIQNTIECVPQETIITTTVPIECNQPTAADVAKDANEVTDILDKEEVSAEVYSELPSPPPEIVENTLIDTDEVPNLLQSKISADPIELAKESPSKTEQSLKEKLLEHTETEVLPPPPPAELINEIEMGSAPALESSETELPVTPSEEAKIENNLENEVIPKTETSTPISQALTTCSNDISTAQHLPNPPPSIHDEAGDVLLVNNVVSEKSEIKLDLTEIIVNSKVISNTEDTINIQVEHDNENESIDKNSVKKSKHSLDNVTEIINCNGNSKIEIEESISEISAKESELTQGAKDIGNKESDKTVTSLELSMPASPSEVESVADDNEESLPLPLPPSELCAEPAAPQEPLPVSDKLADLIPKVPEVPELKTETLQETTSGDGGITN